MSIRAGSKSCAAIRTVTDRFCHSSRPARSGIPCGHRRWLAQPLSFCPGGRSANGLRLGHRAVTSGTTSMGLPMVPASGSN